MLDGEVAGHARYASRKVLVKPFLRWYEEILKRIRAIFEADGCFSRNLVDCWCWSSKQEARREFAADRNG